MAIGEFDSGVGGLTIHRAFHTHFPDADLIYYGDQANTPYGGRPGVEIVDLTRAGWEVLFDRGADVVVLACNTASAIALRTLQQNWLADARVHYGRALNILGVIVPTIVAATGQPWHVEVPRGAVRPAVRDAIAIFATPATATSRVYEIEIDKRREDIAVFSEACPNLARMIETGVARADIKAEIERHVAAVIRRIGRNPDRAILGCTHYEIVADVFAQVLPAGTPLIHQPPAVCAALDRYFARHPEYDIGHSAARVFLTSAPSLADNALVRAFWPEGLALEMA